MVPFIVLDEADHISLNLQEPFGELSDHRRLRWRVVDSCDPFIGRPALSLDASLDKVQGGLPVSGGDGEQAQLDLGALSM